MLEDQMSVYWMTKVSQTNFNFIWSSFSESADIIFKTEEDEWALSSTEVESIRILAPSDSDSMICSFKGIIDYPFKFSQDEKDTCWYKFTEEDVEIGHPRRIITITYTGRVDIFEIYFKDILKNANNTPNSVNFEAQGNEIKLDQEIVPVEPISNKKDTSLLDNLNEQKESEEAKIEVKEPKKTGGFFNTASNENKPAFLNNNSNLPKMSQNKTWGTGQSLAKPDLPDKKVEIFKPKEVKEVPKPFENPLKRPSPPKTTPFLPSHLIHNTPNQNPK